MLPGRGRKQIWNKIVDEIPVAIFERTSFSFRQLLERCRVYSQSIRLRYEMFYDLFEIVSVQDPHRATAAT